MLPKSDAEHLAEVTAVALQDALRIKGYQITQVKAVPLKAPKVGAQISFKLSGANGQNPVQLLARLKQQIETPGSAFHTGPLQRFAEDCQLIWEEDKGKPDKDGPDDGKPDPPDDKDDKRGGRHGRRGGPHGETRIMIVLLVAALVLVVIVVLGAILYARRAAEKAKREVREARLPYGGMEDGMGGGGGGHVVVGRPLEQGQGATGAAAGTVHPGSGKPAPGGSSACADGTANSGSAAAQGASLSPLEAALPPGRSPAWTPTAPAQPPTRVVAQTTQGFTGDPRES